MKTLKVCEICQIEAPRSEVFVDQPWVSSSRISALVLCLYFCKSWKQHQMCKCALCAVDDASCFLVIRLGPKTSVYERHDSVKSTVTGCDVTNCATTLHGFNKQFRSSLLGTGLPVLGRVDCQKRFPMYQAKSMYQVAGFGREDLERLQVGWERGIISHSKVDSTYWNSPESFIKFTLSCNSSVCEVSSCIVV